MFKYFLYKVGQFIVNFLPLKSSYAFALFFSDMQYHCSPRDRQSVRNNLRIITGRTEDVEDDVREIFRNFGRYLNEFFRMKKTLNKEFINKNIEIKNIAVIDEVLKRGKGGILLSGHMGNWELGGAMLAMLGYPVMAVALPHKERWVNKLFNAQRIFFGITVVPTSIAVRRCLESLHSNELIGLVADRDFTNHGIEMDFLGSRAIIPKGPAVFSLKTGAPIIPCFMMRKNEDKFEFRFEMPIYPPEKKMEQIDESVLRSFIKCYLPIIETKIRQFPTQWLMFREFGVK